MVAGVQRGTSGYIDDAFTEFYAVEPSRIIALVRIAAVRFRWNFCTVGIVTDQEI